VKLDVRVDNRVGLLKLQLLGERVYGQGVARALNRAAGRVRAVAAREIAKDLKGYLKTNEIRKAMVIKPRATRAKLEAIVRAGGRRNVPITAFKVRGNGRGVSARIAGKAVQIDGAWIASPKGWNRDAVRVRAQSWRVQRFDQVDRRTRRARRGGPDYPLAEIVAPGVPELFIERRVQQLMRTEAQRRFQEVIAQEFRYAMSRI